MRHNQYFIEFPRKELSEDSELPLRSSVRTVSCPQIRKFLHNFSLHRQSNDASAELVKFVFQRDPGLSHFSWWWFVAGVFSFKT